MKQTYDEEAVRGFRELYHNFGYKPYKMSKFEEYDLYADNKSFLSSERIVTFPGAGGRLMALRPDVTLSIVKNAAAGANGLEKLYYNETVYRTAPDGELKEISQVGLECIGRLDCYAMGEVVLLAAKSLACVSEATGKCYLLTLSHMGIVGTLLDAALPVDAEPALRERMLGCIGSKNAHGLRTLCAEEEIADDAAARLETLMQCSGGYEEVIDTLRSLCAGNAAAEEGLAELEQIARLLSLWEAADKLRFDFSLVNNLQYYNGVIFKGYLRGLPCELLSGGRYDRLVQRFGREGGAIGFGINLELLKQLAQTDGEYDVDVLLTYDSAADLGALVRAVQMLRAGGQSVRVQPAGTLENLPAKLSYRQQLSLNERGLEIIERDA